MKSKKIKKLEAAIRYIAASDSFAFISELELNDIETVNRKDAMNSKIVWNSNIKGMWYTYLKACRIAKRNQKAKLLVIGINSVLLIVVMTLVICGLLFI